MPALALRRSRVLSLTLAALGLALPALAQEPTPAPRRDPLRLASLGDSVTEAINAEEFNPLKGLTRNRWASWVNGYTKDWNSLLDRTDVNSHNQRISAQFGKEGRKNKLMAKRGAESEKLFKQARKAVKRRSDYVTILMGQNDVCGDDVSEIPIDAEFEANVRAGFDVLREGLPPGATIYTLAIIDIYRLWQIGDELEAFGIIECSELWERLGSKIPCATMLDPDNEEADRQFTRGRIIAFNTILANLVDEYAAEDPLHYWEFTDVSFTMQFEADDVSAIDCFHPSAEGQARLSAETWAVGPFAAVASPTPTPLASPTPTATATPSATPTPTPTASP
jgi:lysophospholipase L1-like esterase